MGIERPVEEGQLNQVIGGKLKLSIDFQVNIRTKCRTLP